MYAFDLERPSTLAEAVSALAEEGAMALAGGQTLLPTMKARLTQTERLVALSQIHELRGICREAGGAGRLCIGATTTHAEVAAAPDMIPVLAQMAARIGDPAVRNRGTLGGSLANNDPSACYPAAVLALGATIRTHLREIPADAYFQGMFTTALEEGEVITEVKFPEPLAASYQKFVQPASRFALVGVCVARFASGVRVAVTGAANEGVFRWQAAEEALSGDCRGGALAGLTLPAEDMIADLHGSAAYRAHLVTVLAKRAVEAL